LSFDLSDTTLSGVSIFNATFETQPIFRNTIWTGDSHFSGVQFLKGAVFDRCKIDGALEVDKFTTADELSVDNLTVSKGATFRLCASEILTGRIHINDSTVLGTMRVEVPSKCPSPRPRRGNPTSFSATRFTVDEDGPTGTEVERFHAYLLRHFDVALIHALVEHGGLIQIANTFYVSDPRVEYRDVQIDASQWHIKDGGEVFLEQKLIDTDQLNWEPAAVEDGAVIDTREEHPYLPDVITLPDWTDAITFPD
jgi:hypothetical protein